MRNITDTTFRFASANPGGNKRVRNAFVCTFTCSYHVTQSVIFTCRPVSNYSAVVAKFSKIYSQNHFPSAVFSNPCLKESIDWN